MNIFEVVPVNTRCDQRGEESPVSFTYHDEKIDITDIVDRWYEGGIKAGGPVYNYFKVQTASSEEFLLRYNTNRHVWAVWIGKD
jgi:hypothetical protein